MATAQLCMTCCSNIAAEPSGSGGNKRTMKPLVHSCCGRMVCNNCIISNARLSTFCPFCEDAQSAFKKGRRNDVVHAGDTLFDLDKVLATRGDDHSAAPLERPQEEESPPQYTASSNDFVIGADEDYAAEVVSRRPPVQVQSKSLPSDPEVLKPSSTHNPSATLWHKDLSALPERIKVPVDTQLSEKSKQAEERRKAAAGEHDTRQYWLRPQDTLAGLALRFKVSSAKLCSLNQLPRSALSTTPHILHTRRWILIPADSIPASALSDPQIQAGLSGPPKKSTASKIATARRAAEAQFRAVAMRDHTGKDGETPPDERAARAYIALVEQELAWVDFGDGPAEASTEKKDGGIPSEEEDEQEQQLRDAGRAARYDAILSQAVSRWMMDSDWERAQRAAGLDPGQVSQQFKSKMTNHSNRQSNGGSGIKSALSEWLGLGKTTGEGMQARPERGSFVSVKN